MSERILKALRAASSALKSYAAGNSATELASEVAEACDAVIAAEEKLKVSWHLMTTEERKETLRALQEFLAEGQQEIEVDPMLADFRGIVNAFGQLLAVVSSLNEQVGDIGRKDLS